MIELNQILNADCMDIMKDIPDKYFELAIVDPPYGIGKDFQKLTICKNVRHNRKEHIKKDWDSSIPDENYFNELFRISQNQIIFGGNYFTEFLKPTRAWIFWYKGQNDLTMSDGEMIWTSFDKVTRQIEINRVQLAIQKTFHPTEKPYKLYKWLLSNYAKPNDKILDTHSGSASLVVACIDMGFEYLAIEKDSDYYIQACKRVEKELQKIKIDF